MEADNFLCLSPCSVNTRITKYISYGLAVDSHPLQSVMMSLNNGTATESGIPVNAPDSSSNNLSSETSVPGDFCFTPGSAFLSPGTEGMLPQSYNNGYLESQGGNWKQGGKGRSARAVSTGRAVGRDAERRRKQSLARPSWFQLHLWGHFCKWSVNADGF